MFERWKTLWRETRLVGGRSLARAPLILLFTLLAAGLDLLGVALIAPFISLLMSPEHPAIELPAPVMAMLGERPVQNFGLLLVVVFGSKACATFALQGAIARLTESIRADVMSRLLAAYQHREYQFHLDHSSADLVNRVVWYSQAFAANFVGSILRFMADGLVFLALAALIAIANVAAALLLAAVLSGVFLVIVKSIRNRGTRVTENIAQSTADVIHSTTQALGGLREVRVLGCEEYFRRRLEAAAARLVDNTETASILGSVPRQAIEFSMVLFLVVLIFFTLNQDGGGSALIPLMGLIGAAAVRLMPASTSLLSSLNQIKANRFVVTKLVQDLAPVSVGGGNIGRSQSNADTVAASSGSILGNRFHSICADRIGFRYGADREPVFSNLSIEIGEGEIVGLFGPSGSGKSTLADLLLGFLQPHTGEIRVNQHKLAGNERAWQSMAAYIPQQSYLIDDTLLRNVALGVPDAEIDGGRVLEALKNAQLGELLETLPDGLATQLGERGVRISGGQRQRVSIARAFYHDRDFLLLDEATSALDHETEIEIVDLIRNLRGKKTILIISHNEKTMSICNKVIRLPQ